MLLPFTDVGRVDWFSGAVSEMYSAGLMDGVSATRFAPEQPMTRAQIHQIFYSMAGKPAVTGECPRFSDVAPDAWYADAVAWAAQQGLSAGCGGGQMCPEERLTREQLAVLFSAWAGLNGLRGEERADLAPYEDAADLSLWAEDAVRWAVGAGLMNGYSESCLAPQGVVTRAEAAQMTVHFKALGR